jgi:hypothetical protein
MTTVNYDASIDAKANNISVLCSQLQTILAGSAQQALTELHPRYEHGAQVFTYVLDYRVMKWNSTMPCPVVVHGRGTTTKEAKRAAARGMVDIVNKLQAENQPGLPPLTTTATSSSYPPVSLPTNPSVTLDAGVLLSIIQTLQTAESALHDARVQLDQHTSKQILTQSDKAARLDSLSYSRPL